MPELTARLSDLLTWCQAHPAEALQIALLASVFIVAACGLAYELIAGALASYLLGDSVMQFSTVIGTYLFAMGVGSWLSKYITRDLIGRFIQIELMVGLLGSAAWHLRRLMAAHRQKASGNLRQDRQLTVRSSSSGLRPAGR